MRIRKRNSGSAATPAQRSLVLVILVGVTVYMFASGKYQVPHPITSVGVLVDHQYDLTLAVAGTVFPVREKLSGSRIQNEIKVPAGRRVVDPVVIGARQGHAAGEACGDFVLVECLEFKRTGGRDDQRVDVERNDRRRRLARDRGPEERQRRNYSKKIIPPHD